MKKIEWKADMTHDELQLKWMREFIKKPFNERFSYICKLQLMNRNAGKVNDSLGRKIEWKN